MLSNWWCKWNTFLCFASSQVSQWNILTSTPWNKIGHEILRVLKGGWPKCKWYKPIYFYCWRDDLASEDKDNWLLMVQSICLINMCFYMFYYLSYFSLFLCCARAAVCTLSFHILSCTYFLFKYASLSWVRQVKPSKILSS